ncbi:hypothetical protein E5170_19855 [Pseudomonas atacamensis]|uniref:Uncharacterized protein n=1 Tax=Pseudomonas atacamensis TaxID=2565368 RepID=A0AAQ2I004_9PSED|nr:hypothetical protein E5170_19855 [Pseudomonas atacamensis]
MVGESETGGISVAAVTASYGFALTASPFFKRRSAGTAKRNQKALPRRTARSLGLGVPSLRDRSGRSLLKGQKIKAKAKARSRAPHPSPLPEGEGTDRGV